MNHWLRKDCTGFQAINFVQLLIFRTLEISELHDSEPGGKVQTVKMGKVGMVSLDCI